MSISKRLDEAVERYPESWKVRSIVQAIPYLGGVIDNIVTGKVTTVQRERFELFIEELRDACVSLNGEKLDKGFIESDEFVDLFVNVSERVVRTHEDEKREALRNAFLKATTKDGSKGPFKEIAIRLIGDLTVDHMRVLRVVAGRQAQFTEADRQANEDFTSLDQLAACLSEEIPRVDIRAVAYDLMNMGLLGNWWARRYDQPEETDRFRLTEVGRKFIGFITA
jgi:hypothetical protein